MQSLINILKSIVKDLLLVAVIALGVFCIHIFLTQTKLQAFPYKEIFAEASPKDPAPSPAAEPNLPLIKINEPNFTTIVPAGSVLTNTKGTEMPLKLFKFMFEGTWDKTPSANKKSNVVGLEKDTNNIYVWEKTTDNKFKIKYEKKLRDRYQTSVLTNVLKLATFGDIDGDGEDDLVGMQDFSSTVFIWSNNTSTNTKFDYITKFEGKIRDNGTYIVPINELDVASTTKVDNNVYFSAHRLTNNYTYTWTISKFDPHYYPLVKTDTK